MAENEEELAPHVEDIRRALGNKVDADVIRTELEKYLRQYMVPLNEAKRGIVKKHGGNPLDLGIGVERKLNELKPDDISVDLLCRVVAVNPKEITREGEKKRIYYGILGDTTGTVAFTAWEDFGLAKGDVIRIRNAGVKTWQGVPQINIGARSTVLKESPEALPPFDITKISRECKIKDISARERLGNLTVTARVLSVEAKEIQVGEGEPPKTIYKGILGDGTGKIQFTAWHDFNLNKGDVIKIIGGYVKSWRGLLQLNFDERARVEREADDALPSIEEIDIERPISIGELIERGGATGVVIEGVVLDVRSGSGLIFRCPECNRVLQKGVCMIHGKAEGVPDLRVKAIIDDGTGALTAILDKSITERILGKSLEECKKLAQEKMDYDIIKDELTNLLVAKPIRVRGNVTSDEFGLMTVGATATLIERDVKHEAEKMLEDLGG